MKTFEKSPIPGWAYKQLVLDNRIAHGAFRLWHLLRDYAGKKMQCWPGQRRLSKDLGSNFDSIAKWRDSLIKNGWLKVEKRKNGGHQYFILIPPPVTTATESGSTTPAKNHDRTEKAHALIRLAGFRVPFDDKLDFQLSLDTAPTTFSHYVKEFEDLWKASSKILFLTGEPECGKTTLLTKLQGELEGLGSIYFCMSKATTDGTGKRTGFETITSYDSKPRQIAIRDESGIYKPNLAVIDAIAAEIESASHKCRLLIIDEIGPIQLQSAAFANVINNLLEKPSVSVIASIALDDSKHVLLKKFKSHFRPSLVRLEKQRNDQSILEQMQSEAESLLKRPAFYEENESGNKKIRRS